MEEFSVLPCSVIINSGHHSYARDTIEAWDAAALQIHPGFETLFKGIDLKKPLITISKDGKEE
jgi:hypothetical protein